MICFIKKLRALLFGLNSNRLNFLQAFCVSISYSLVTLMFYQSGASIGFFFNLFLFAVLGAAVRQGDSLFCNLAMTRSDKVKIAYQSFAFIILLILLWKVFIGLIWNLILLKVTGKDFQSLFFFYTPEAKRYYINQVYTFFITMGFEFLLFPILFMRRTRHQIVYFIKTALSCIFLTWIFCYIGRLLSENQNKDWQHIWSLSEIFEEMPQRFLVIAPCYAFFFLTGSAWAAFRIANKQFEKERKQQIYQRATENMVRKRHWLIMAVSAVGVVLVMGVSFLLFPVVKQLKEIRSLKVAGTQLTDDTVFGPMVMNGEVYLPSTYIPELVNEENRGLFLYKGENQNDIMYGLFFANYAYTDLTDEQKTYCRVKGSDLHSYVRADHMERLYDRNDYEKAIILDPDFLEKQSRAADNSRVGIHDLELKYLDDLEAMFGEVTYEPEDFAQIESYYPILGIREAYVYKEWESESTYYLNHSQVIGCILVKSGNYYYGNLKNLIPKEAIPSIY